MHKRPGFILGVGGFEIYRKFEGSSLTIERTTVHVSDDVGRIAMLEKRTIGTDDAEEVLTRYVYSNHLQSASLELDGIGDIISYEEYHPYGTTAFQAKNASINAVAKRYRYTGKERDEESGLYYHGARYYIPWLCRWTAIDPLESKYAGMSPYNYSFNNPIIWNDPSGADPKEGGDNSFEGFPQNPKDEEIHTKENGDKYIYYSGVGWSGSADGATVIGRRKGGVTDGVLANYGRLSSTQYIEETEAGFSKAAAIQRFEEQKRFEEQVRLNTRFIGQDRITGKAFNVSVRQIEQARYEMNESGGAAIRNGPFAAGISLLYNALGNDPMRGALVGSVVDGVAMSFSGVGTPYGKPTLMYEQMPSQSAKGRNMPYIPVVKSDATIMNFAGRFSVGTNRALEVSSPNSTYVQKNNSGEITGMYFYNSKGENFSMFHFKQGASHKVRFDGQRFDLKNHPHEHQTRWLTAPNGNLYQKEQVRLISPTGKPSSIWVNSR